jgi:glucosamine--fructose-6-phosphate aminotransferase (isomerizing)
MCGITGCVSTDGCVDALLDGLQRLEYRGYDSAGIAIQNGAGIEVIKRAGEVEELTRRVRELASEGGVFDGRLGIGHTRWSTHGPPTDRNAHPHMDCTGEVAVVHNGIIDNYDSLKRELEAAGHRFASETDTEVIPHLVEAGLDAGRSPEAAVRRAVQQLSGSYAVGVVVGDDESIYAARKGSPLVLGVGEDRSFLASDVPAFIQYTDRVVYLHDGDFVTLTADGYEITDLRGAPVTRTVETVDWDPETASKGGYDHYMCKEINEQPLSLRETIRGRVNALDGQVTLPEFPPGLFADVEDVHFIAMGTSYHAAMYASSLLTMRGLSAHAYIAGEYSVVRPRVTERTLVVAVTQSGETADTLDALRRARDAGARTLAVTNVLGSSVTRECDHSMFLRAGPEIGVAATKTFSSQVTALALLNERLVRDVQGQWSDESRELLAATADLPGHVQAVLDTSEAAEIAREFQDSDAYFFIGRGLAHPVALEGALKFKEITYAHAEGFAAAELKHGPLALVSEATPVFTIFTGRNDEATLNNLKEVQARGAPVVAIASPENRAAAEFADHVLTVPETHPDVAGILANVQLQLVAYHAADYMDRDIDKPRNLAKSVTVE